MTTRRSMVILQQSNLIKLQIHAKELENFGCVLPYKFVAEGIIAKFPPSWMGFATSLKHKRQEFDVVDLIGYQGVEEKERKRLSWQEG